MPKPEKEYLKDIEGSRDRVRKIAEDLEDPLNDLYENGLSSRIRALVLSTYSINGRSCDAALRLLQNRTLKYYSDHSIDLRKQMAEQLRKTAKGGFHFVICDILRLDDTYSAWLRNQEKVAEEETGFGIMYNDGTSEKGGDVDEIPQEINNEEVNESINNEICNSIRGHCTIQSLSSGGGDSKGVSSELRGKKIPDDTILLPESSQSLPEKKCSKLPGMGDGMIRPRARSFDLGDKDTSDKTPDEQIMRSVAKEHISFAGKLNRQPISESAIYSGKAIFHISAFSSQSVNTSDIPSLV